MYQKETVASLTIIYRYLLLCFAFGVNRFELKHPTGENGRSRICGIHKVHALRHGFFNRRVYEKCPLVCDSLRVNGSSTVVHSNLQIHKQRENVLCCTKLKHTLCLCLCFLAMTPCHPTDFTKNLGKLIVFQNQWDLLLLAPDQWSVT